MDTSITFYGATDTVTGSRHLLETAGKRVLVDCGLFQGPREIRERNWKPFAVRPDSLDAVVLTHAHMDHTGYLPRVVKHGYRGPVYCTPATRDLLHVMLKDSARLQKEEAEHANRHGWSRHHPALPLYDEEDVRRCLSQLEPVDYDTLFEPVPGVATHFIRAGHILGSAFVSAETDAGRVLFGGDLGRYDQSIIPDPTPVTQADYLLLESTYGDRDHANMDVEQTLIGVIETAVKNKGWILIPSFAVGRTQELLYLLNKIWRQGRATELDVYIDSPMAVSVTPMFASHAQDHDLEMSALMDARQSPFDGPNFRYLHSRDDSKALNDRPGPGIIIAGSGMANGGRIRHHLLNHISEPTTTLLFVGYQGVGTPGRAILDGAEMFRAYGWEVPIRARKVRVDALSAHADRGEIMRWLGHFTTPPKRTFLVHGEPQARQALNARITTELGWNVYLPSLAERCVLGGDGGAR
ncbi:MAG: MBL fold metallo-hydrolase RNA specificity domain-containing protein [Armatimonadota bacterium]